MRLLTMSVNLADHASALAFELLRGPAPERREFLRIKFKNGTNSNFETYHIFGHQGDIAVTEFMYRLEVRFPFRSCLALNFFFQCRTLLLQAKNNGNLPVEFIAPTLASRLLLKA